MKTSGAALVSVEEIQAAVLRLPRAEAVRLSAWFAEREAAGWDRELASDASAGRLDFLAEEAEREYRTGALRPWPGKAQP